MRIKPTTDLFNFGSIFTDMMTDFRSMITGTNEFQIPHIDTDVVHSDDNSDSSPKTPIEVTTTKIISADFICIGPETYFDKKKDIIRFNSGDSIILPKNCGERLLKSSMKLYAVKITNEGTNISSYGKVSGFDAPDRYVVVPQWIMSSLFVVPGDKVSIDTVNIGNVTKIKFSIPKCIPDPQSVIEFELRNHSLSYVGKQINIKMFDKNYNITVNEQYPLYVGVVENQDIDIDIDLTE
jgi:hypothetical protein